MTDFSEGDLIEATKGESVLRGRLVWTEQPGLIISKTDWGVTSLEIDGWTLTVIERATPPLPTAKGWYMDGRGVLWDLRHNSHGDPEWYCDDDFVGLPHVEQYGPFVQWAPVADTAKKVLDRFEEVFNASFIQLPDALESVRTEFGATK